MHVLTCTRWFRPSSSTRPSPAGHAIYEAPQWLVGAQQGARRCRTRETLDGRQEWEMFLICPSVCPGAVVWDFMSYGSGSSSSGRAESDELTRHKGSRQNCLGPWLRRPYHTSDQPQATQSWRSAGTNNSHNNKKKHVCRGGRYTVPESGAAVGRLRMYIHSTPHQAPST
jgi:hypothetical protein